MEQTTLENVAATVHEKKRQFECPKCLKTFTQQGNMKLHMAYICQFRSSTKKPLDCQICGKSFNNKKNLEIHVITMHKKKGTFQCPECDKTFGYKCTMEKHFAQVHKSQECKICHVKFTENELKEHTSNVYNTCALQLAAL